MKTLRFLLPLILFPVLCWAETNYYLGGPVAASGGGCTTSNDSALIDHTNTSTSSIAGFYTFEKITISAKPFAVGFRIEHRQEFINTAFYGDKVNIGITGPANYRLTAKHAGKGIFSFCQCPGGEIVGASSELGGVVTNGMSSSSRSGEYANSAIVTTVNESDFGTDPLAAMEFQQKIELSKEICELEFF